MICPVPSDLLLPELQIWRDDQFRTPSENMAVDEQLLSLSFPVLRFYRWERPAVSVGTMASAQEAERFACGRPWVRRWTGGGMVEHGNDLTVSLALPSRHVPRQMDAMTIYRWIHRAVQKSVQPELPDVRLAEIADFSNGPRCFESPVCADLMQGNSKVLGGALRRSRFGTLYQGSLQQIVPPAEMFRRMAMELAGQYSEWKPDRDFLQTAQTLSVSRYGSTSWIERRP